MKKITLISFLFLIFNLCNGQEKPSVKFVSTTNVVGTCNYGSIVTASYRIKKTPTPIDTTTTLLIKDIDTVTSDNKFKILFTHPRTVKDSISVWIKEKDINKYKYVVDDEKTIVEKLTKNATTSESSYVGELEAINEFKAQKDALKNTTLTYATTIWSTNFNIPLIRFNLIKDDATKKGDVLIFNSIGAGIGRSWGHLERTRDNLGEIVNEEFSSTFGIHLGALFSAGTGEDIKNVFAPTLNLSILDFQFGIGYELGSILPSQKREFITLSYAIPLYKLFKRSYRLSSSTEAPISSSIKTQN